MFASSLLIVGTFLQILVQSTMAIADAKDTYHLALKSHDNYRKLHGASLFVTFDDALMNYADNCTEEWVNAYVKNPSFILEECPPYGKHNSNNTGLTYEVVDGIISSSEGEKVEKVMNGWYDNYKGYNFYDPAKSTGNFKAFTQMVWLGSTKIGFCLRHYFEHYNPNIRPNRTVIIAVYEPKGNVKNPDGSDNWDEYKRNVFPNGSEPCPCPEPTEGPTTTTTTEKETTTTEVSVGTTTLSTIKTTTPEVCRCPIKTDNSSCHLTGAFFWIIICILVRHLLF